MFTCINCLRRTIRSLPIFHLQAAHLENVVALPSTKSTTSTTIKQSRRGHATIASIQKGHHRRLLRQASQKNYDVPASRGERLRGPSLVTRRNRKAVEANKHRLDIRNDNDRGQPLWAADIDAALRTDLRWTGGDPLKLAKTVLDKLKAGDSSRALEMVRASEKMPGSGKSKTVDNIVSWNHIVDYHMSIGKTREAFKVFNEMKKRGHKPDAHTFTIMLRGYTMNHRNHKATDEAMSVYDSIWRPESNVKPSIIHSNAVINCLGRALKMDALWSVAGRLPDRGPGSPDKWTYTTILNTIQACALRDARQLAEADGDQEAAAKVMQSAIGDGKRLWEDIVSRWRSGDVNIDQTLVCAMGRLLLLGGRQDWDDVFSLVEQTMRLPRMEPPRQFHKAGEYEEPESTLPVSSPQTASPPLGLSLLEEAVSEEESPRLKSEFAAVDLTERPDQGTRGADIVSPYANVGCNVLSLLIEAAIKLRAISTGKAYWETLTDPEAEPSVTPDDENLHTYLRLLRMSRSSSAICDLLRHPPNAASEGTWYKRGTFVLAMSTCARDFKNPNVFTNASAILDMMQAKLPEPDLKVMSMYLSLAVVTTPGVSSEMAGDFRIHRGGNNLIRALHRLNQPELECGNLLQQLRERHADKHQKEYQRDVGKKRAEKEARPPPLPAFAPPEELLELMQNLNGAYDKILNYRLKMTDQMAKEFTWNKQNISRQVQKMQSKRPPPPSLSQSRPSDPADKLTDHDHDLQSSRYPDKMARRTTPDRKIKGPRVVNLEQRHPFLAKRTQSDKDRSSVAEGGDLWKASQREMKHKEGRNWFVV